MNKWYTVYDDKTICPCDNCRILANPIEWCMIKKLEEKE